MTTARTPSPAPRFLRLAAAMSTFLCLPWAGCVGTAAPDPPDFEPPMPPDVSELEVMGPAGQEGDLTVGIFGGPGAVQPGVTVFGVGLFTTASPATTEADETGAFELLVTVFSGRPIARLQTRDGDRRSEPLDLNVSTANAQPVPIELDPCVGLDPQLPLGDGTMPVAREMSVTNACGADLTVTRIAERVPLGSLSIDEDVPRTIPVGATEAFLVSYTPGESIDDVLLVDFEGAVTETRAVSVYVGP